MTFAHDPGKMDYQWGQTLNALREATIMNNPILFANVLMDGIENIRPLIDTLPQDEQDKFVVPALVPGEGRDEEEAELNGERVLFRKCQEIKGRANTLLAAKGHYTWMPKKMSKGGPKALGENDYDPETLPTDDEEGVVVEVE